MIICRHMCDKQFENIIKTYNRTLNRSQYSLWDRRIGEGWFAGAQLHCVPKAPVCEVSSRLYLLAYCLNPYNTMHFTRFRHRRNATNKLNWLNRVNALCFVDLNNRQTGKHATKLRALGFLGHSELLSTEI